MSHLDPTIFTDAAKHVIAHMLGGEIKFRDPTKDSVDDNANIAVVVGLSGDVAGSVVMALPETTALNLVRRIANMELKVCDPDFSDSLASVLNMIVDQADHDLPAMHVQRTLSQILVGSHLHVLAVKRQPMTIFCSKTSFGPMQLLVSLVDQPQTAAA